MVHDGITGVLVPNTAADWEAALQKACSDAVWREPLALAAMRDVRARFRFERL